MRWVASDDQLPSGAALVYAEGGYYLAVLVAEPNGSEPAFMDLHSADTLPWPSHWMPLPGAPL